MPGNINPFSIAASAVSTGAGLFGSIFNAVQGKRNREFQETAYNQSLELQREAWDREDNAAQRRMADLKAAGLNPLLAVGQPASSSGPIKPEAPQTREIELMQAMQGLAMAEELSKSKTERARIRAETALLNQERRFRDQINPFKRSWYSQQPALAELQHMRGMRSYDIDAEELAQAQHQTQFSEETLRNRISLVAESLTAAERDNALRLQEHELYTRKIAREGAEANRLAWEFKHLLPKQLDEITNRIAIQQLQIEMDKHNLDIAQLMRLPTGQRLNAMQYLALQVAEFLQSLRGGRTPRTTIPRFVPDGKGGGSGKY